MVLLNSSNMELLKQDHEDDVADGDSSICGDDNGAAAAGDHENDDDDDNDDDADDIDYDDDKMSNNFPQMPGCRLCLSCVRRL